MFAFFEMDVYICVMKHIREDDLTNTSDFFRSVCIFQFFSCVLNECEQRVVHETKIERKSENEKMKRGYLPFGIPIL